MSDPQMWLLVHHQVAREIDEAHRRRVLRRCCGLVREAQRSARARVAGRLARILPTRRPPEVACCA